MFFVSSYKDLLKNCLLELLKQKKFKKNPNCKNRDFNFIF